MFVSKEKYQKALDEINYLKDVFKDNKKEHAEMVKKFEDERALAFKTMELDFKDKMRTEIDKLERSHRRELDKIRQESQEKLNKGVEENFTKLKESLSKLHEEGNANTKYLEKMSISIMENFAKSQRTALGYQEQQEE